MQESIIDRQGKEIDARDSEIAALKNRLIIMDEVILQRNQLQDRLKEYQAEREKLHQLIEKTKKEYEELRAGDLKRFEEIIEAKRIVEADNVTKEKLITELKITIKGLEGQKHMLVLKIGTLEDKIEVLKDVKAQLDTATKQVEEMTESKNKLRQELETAGDYMVDQEDKLNHAKQQSLELLRQLKDTEAEVDLLKQYIIELKSKMAVYIPAKDDVVDKRLAEFINNYPERKDLKIMFIRESEGIYSFGTKRIYVRVEKDKIIIRVGGGYLTIEEFLDIYTPIELEKLERKEPMKRFNERYAV